MAEQFIVTFILLGILGIFVSGYLIKGRIKKKSAVCPIGDEGSCEKVLESKWNSILGIKNDLIGFIFYWIIIGFGLALYFISNYQNLFITYEKLIVLIKLITGIGFLFSMILTFIQIRIIKEYCFYCLISSGINLLIFINMFAL